jgi:hypothetical protein
MQHHRSVNRLDYVIEGAVNASMVPERTSGWKYKDMAAICRAAASNGLLKYKATADQVCAQLTHASTHFTTLSTTHASTHFTTLSTTHASTHFTTHSTTHASTHFTTHSTTHVSTHFTTLSTTQVCTQWRVHFDTNEADRLRAAYENKVVWRAQRRYLDMKPDNNSWDALAKMLFELEDGTTHGGPIIPGL